jgi:hypothetical protein
MHWGQINTPRTQSEQQEYILGYVAACCATTLESLSFWMWGRVGGERVGDALGPRLAALQQHIAKNDNNNNNIYAVEHGIQHKGL